jgi:phage repressor protein C with HTH and peptisase S24 domain
VVKRITSENENTAITKSTQAGLQLFKFRMSLGLSQSAFGRRFGGFSEADIRSFEDNQAEIPFRLFSNIRRQQFHELTPLFKELHGAAAEFTLRTIAQEHILSAEEAEPFFEELTISNPEARKPTFESREVAVAKIPIVEDRIAVPPGTPLDFFTVEHWCRVPKSKLRLGSSYYVIRISDNSMEPQFRANDLALVDLSTRDPRKLSNRIVAFWLGSTGGATIKLLQEDQHNSFWLLRSHNPSYREIVVPKDRPDFTVAAVRAAWLNLD